MKVESIRRWGWGGLSDVAWGIFFSKWAEHRVYVGKVKALEEGVVVVDVERYFVVVVQWLIPSKFSCFYGSPGFDFHSFFFKRATSVVLIKDININSHYGINTSINIHQLQSHLNIKLLPWYLRNPIHTLARFNCLSITIEDFPRHFLFSLVRTIISLRSRGFDVRSGINSQVRQTILSLRLDVTYN